MSDTGVIVLAHGSRGERAASELPSALSKMAEGLRLLLSDNADVIGASLQFNHPDLEEAADALIAGGARRIIIAPYFLFFGRHLTEDIPSKINQLRLTHNDVHFILTDNLGMHEYFVQLMARRIIDACPELLPLALASTTSPKTIETQSMEIVERFLPTDLKDGQRAVTGRIIHASGDPFIAHLVRFSPSAITSGLEAISAGSPIFTDVKMAAAGIDRRLAKAHGCSVVCALDEVRPENTRDPGRTRSAAAMNSLATKLNSSIVAIGNAPTALLALIDLIDSKRTAPKLVVGMPVGFVQARESKAELMKRNVPFIVVEGTRGGSAMAAAAVNALLKLAT
jgi:precorrin-8X/cobalt-precorrin-8 methylmutase